MGLFQGKCMFASNLPKTSCVAPFRRAALIVNARSRRGSEWFDQVKQQLVDHGVELVDAKAVRTSKRIGPMVERLVQSGVPLVIVGGGTAPLVGWFGILPTDQPSLA